MLSTLKENLNKAEIKLDEAKEAICQLKKFVGFCES